MKLKVIILTIIFIGCLSLVNTAQNSNSDSHNLNITIPEVALLSIVSDSETNIELNTNAPNEAGSEIDFNNTSNNRIWINYSSIISKTTPRRKVVAMVQGDIPVGVRLKVEASDYSGSGKGRLGKPAGEVELSNQPSDIILDIGSCYTGKGSKNGHYLTYKLEKNESANSYAMISQQETSLNVVYTLTDYN